MTPNGIDPLPHARELSRTHLEATLRRGLSEHSAREGARQIWMALHQRGALSSEALDVESPRWIEVASRAMRFEPQLELLDANHLEEDGSRKLLFALRRLAGERIECVAIPRRDDLTLCVSSQVGCPLACAFCATGLLGLKANLTTGEILEQHVHAERQCQKRVTDVVFMGMGEPLLNYDAVLQAAYTLSDRQGPQISHRKITLSTAGVVPKIRQYVEEGHRFPLFFSIASAIPEKRRRLMPIEAAHPLPEFIDAIRLYQTAHKRNRWVTIAYVAIEGENMGPEDVDALGAAFEGIPFIVDVIPYNSTDARFRAPSWSEVRRFTLDLRRLGVPIKVRYSSGKKQGGGCGQLAAGLVPAGEAQGHLLAPAGIYSDLPR